MQLKTLYGLLALCIPSVRSAGHFTNPAGVDGSLNVSIGQQIDVAWTNTEDYPILSLGVFSSTNQTISWFIGNSNAHPTSYTWTVNATALGFDLTSSRLFQFYICNGTNFGAPFYSSHFSINDAVSPSSSESPTSSATTTALPTDTSEPFAQGVSYDSDKGGLTRAGLIGVSIALPIGLIILMCAAGCFYDRRRKKKSGSEPNTALSSDAARPAEMASNEAPGQPAIGQSSYDPNTTFASKSGFSNDFYSSSTATKPREDPNAIHEIGSDGTAGRHQSAGNAQVRAELPASSSYGPRYA